MAKTIILAADDSPAALQAARLIAAYQGDRQRLEVVALNVQSRPVTLWPGPAVDAEAVDRALREKGERQLDPACKLLADAGLVPQRAVRLAIAAEGIADEAMRRGAEAIVMGTRGQGALRGFALGSIALRVVHRAQAPVVLVQPDTRLPASLGAGARILVPLDGSAHADRAVNHVLEWKEWLGETHVDLLHVRPPAAFWQDLLPPQGTLLDEWGSEEAERATRDSRALLYVARAPHELHEAEGDACAQIVRLAGVLGSELIVMGTRGLGAVHHALVGSTALKVTHASPVPVVLVP
jgi:nucleotide-binding universal stress UspA family protein